MLKHVKAVMLGRGTAQHSGRKLELRAGHVGKMLLQQLIEATFFLVQVHFNAHIQCPKKLHIYNL